MQLVRQAVGAVRRAYGVVNNRAEGNAPLTVEGLVGMLRGYRCWPQDPSILQAISTLSKRSAMSIRLLNTARNSYFSNFPFVCTSCNILRKFSAVDISDSLHIKAESAGSPGNAPLTALTSQLPETS